MSNRLAYRRQSLSTLSPELVLSIVELFRHQSQIVRHGQRNWLPVSLTDLEQDANAPDVFDGKRDFLEEVFVSHGWDDPVCDARHRRRFWISSR